MGTPDNFLGCQSFAVLVVYSQRSHTRRVVWETTRCHDSRPTEGTWKCVEDGRVWMAITAHQGNFQRVTKLLKVLHMKDLQFFPLGVLPKQLGRGSNIFMSAHTSLLYNKQSALLHWGHFFFKAYEVNQKLLCKCRDISVCPMYIFAVLFTEFKPSKAEPFDPTEITKRKGDFREKIKTSVFIWNSKCSPPWLLCRRPA